MESNTIRVGLFNFKSFLDIHGQKCLQGTTRTSQQGGGKTQSRQHGSLFCLHFSFTVRPYTSS